MAMYYNGKKVRNLYFNGKCITRLALGKEMTRLVEGDDFVRAEWLVSSVNEGATLPANVAYITLSTPILLDNKVFTVTLGSVHRDLVIYGSVVDGLQYIILIYTYSSGVTTIQERYGNTNTIHSINGTLSGLKSVTLDFKNKVATVGNKSFNIDGVGYQFRGTDANSFGGTKGIGNITIDNELNLIPCRLLRPIPAALDGNGIARSAGECGMYDSISGKFYGNVASSGSFTVEPSLIEGVDYEVHKWLVGDDAYFVIPVNPYQEFLYVKFHPTSSESNHEFWSGYYNIPPNSPIEIRGMIGGSNELGIRFGIRENNVATATVIYKTGLDYLSDFSIETQYSEDNKVNYTFNGTPGIATPIIDSRANVNVSVAFRTTWCKFATVTTGRINLTPVRLLRSLPSYLDANGKARKQFECGMLDLKTMKFYGNVNTNGNFTVSDN